MHAAADGPPRRHGLLPLTDHDTAWQSHAYVAAPLPEGITAPPGPCAPGAGRSAHIHTCTHVACRPRGKSCWGACCRRSCAPADAAGLAVWLLVSRSKHTRHAVSAKACCVTQACCSLMPPKASPTGLLLFSVPPAAEDHERQAGGLNSIPGNSCTQQAQVKPVGHPQHRHRHRGWKDYARGRPWACGAATAPDMHSCE